MTSKKGDNTAPDLSIKDLPSEKERSIVEPVLEKSFEGWYLWHSKRTLKDIETVKAALIGDEPVGVSMLKMLNTKLGYVYYIAVSPEWRGKGIAGELLDTSDEFFFNKGANEVLAGISEDNEESKRLFSSRSYKEISFAELSKRFGRLHAINLYRKMVIVSGEVVYTKELTKGLAGSILTEEVEREKTNS